jgi:hypothetical protein
MATSARDNIVKAVGFDVKKLNYPHASDGSFDYNQGDLLWFDASADIVKALDSDAHAAYICGVALRSSFLAPYSAQNLAGGPALQKNYYQNALVGIGCIASMKTTVGETYKDGTVLYAGADAQTVTTVAGTHSVGVVKLPNGGSAITGAAGVEVPVLVIPQVPVQSL